MSLSSSFYRKSFILTVIAVLVFSLLQLFTIGMNQAEAAACAYPEWNANTIYHGGDRVTYQSSVYEAKWWTQGDRPDQSGEWGVWKFIEHCDGGHQGGGEEGEGGEEEDLIAPTIPGNLKSIIVTAHSVSLSWDASTDNVGVTGYTVYYGANSITVSSTFATISGLNPDTSYTFTVKAHDAAGNESDASNAVTVRTLEQSQTPPVGNHDKILVGYWHNFDNGSGFIRLPDISMDFDVINISFAEPVNGPKDGTIGFEPYQYTQQDFINDVAYLQSLGKKVIISIGGANGQVQLETTQARNNFVNSMKNIISTYGFDGLDIDFEGHSLYLNQGDTDINNPTTPVITNLISAVRELHDYFGDDFMVTMAPETFFVQLGYKFYGGNCLSCDRRAGAYLPVIHGLRDILDWLQVQHYNSGPIAGLDDVMYAMGNADFHVAMADMVLTGFPVAGDPNNYFPALRPDQVLIGLPANVNAGGGFTSVSEVHKALDYLMKGIPYGGSYQLQNGPHPGMRGLMTWSINWDQFNNFEFSTNHRAYLDQFSNGSGGGNGGSGGGDTEPPTAPTNLQVTQVTDTSVSLTWNASTDNVGVAGYTVSYGNQTVNVPGTSVTISGLTPNTTYTFTVKARDASNNVSPGSSIQVTTDQGQGSSNGAQPWAPNVSYKAGDEVTYGGSTYICLQNHVSLLGWEPPNVPALWSLK